MRIDPVGVVGLGLLGRGIAASLVGAGVHVVAFDISQQGPPRGILLYRKRRSGDGSPWRPGSADGSCLA
jgi:3-hydroxyacyl-CoA dehydrogenase